MNTVSNFFWSVVITSALIGLFRYWGIPIAIIYIWARWSYYK